MSVTFSPSLCRFCRNGSGYGKQKTVPTVAGPALGVSRLIFLGREPAQSERLVPLHVDHQHIEWHIVLVKAAHQLIELLIGIGPVARPPRTEGEAWRQRDRPGDLDEVGQRLLVIVTVGEEDTNPAAHRRDGASPMATDCSRLEGSGSPWSRTAGARSRPPLPSRRARSILDRSALWSCRRARRPGFAWCLAGCRYPACQDAT